MNIWFSRLSIEIHPPSVDKHHPVGWKAEWNKKMEEGWVDFLFAWAGTSICCCPQILTLLVLWPLDMYWIVFPGSPACRGQIVALLGHHNFMSQLLWWINLPLFLQIYISYWFCFSRESCMYTTLCIFLWLYCAVQKICVGNQKRSVTIKVKI